MKTQDKKLHRFAAMVAALALATGLGACSGAGQGGASAEQGKAYTVAVIGPDADGAPAYYAEPASYDVGTDAWTATQKSFEAAGLSYDASNTEYGVLLNSIVSPVDGATLAFDEAKGTYWQLFVDGVAAETGIDGVEVKEGTSIVWYYSAFGDALPEGQLKTVSALADAA